MRFQRNRKKFTSNLYAQNDGHGEQVQPPKKMLVNVLLKIIHIHIHYMDQHIHLFRRNFFFATFFESDNRLHFVRKFHVLFEQRH